MKLQCNKHYNINTNKNYHIIFGHWHILPCFFWTFGN